MRITFILPGYPWKPGGGAKIVYEIANNLVKRGYQVNIVHPRNIGPTDNIKAMIRNWRDTLLKPRINWVAIDPRVNLLFVAEPTAAHIPDADFVFATYTPLAEYVLNYPAAKGKKCYLFQHNEFWFAKEKLAAIWRSDLLKVVVSRWLAEIGQAFGAKDIYYIPDAIDQGLFRVTKPIAGRPLRVSMLFSRWAWKGSADGVKALEEAKQKLPALAAVLFGIDKRTSAIPKWIEYYQAPAPKDLVENIYNGSSIHLCPSHSEGFALPPAEALACGCALASTDCGGNRDYAEDGVTALLSPPKEPAALARNILRLAADEALRARLAKAGGQRIEQFNWQRVADLYEKFFAANS